MRKQLLYHLRHSLLFALLLGGLSNYALAQKATLSGVVTDQSGQKLIGATVSVKNTSIGALTNAKGEFTITVPNAATATLLFSYIGYAPVEQAVESRRIFDVVLKEDMTAIEDVVVIGYGSIKSRERSSAISQVNLDNVVEKGIANAGMLLQGAASGIVVNQGDGQPGAPLNMEIRGVNSISGSSQPLIVIDDIPMGNDPSALNLLNPNDIASMSVLKDASATAIYGSRGSNGVILVTLKSAKAGATVINADYNIGISKMDFQMDLLDSFEFANFFNESRRNTGGLNIYLNEQIEGFRDKSYYHPDEITQIGMSHNANINVSGGDAKTKFFLSGQYYDQTGIIVNTGIRRATFKVNIDRQLSSKFNLSAQVLYTNTNQYGDVASGVNGYVAQTYLTPPTVSLRNPDGSYNYNNADKAYQWGSDYSYYDEGSQSTWFYNKQWYSYLAGQNQLGTFNSKRYTNPLAQLLDVVNSTDRSYLFSTLTLKCNAGKGFNITGRLSYTDDALENNKYTPTSINNIATASYRGSAITRNTRSNSLLAEASINYYKRIKKHNITALALANVTSSESRWKQVEARNFNQDLTQNDNLGLGTMMAPPSSFYSGSKMASFVSRVVYSYNNKYSMTASVRADGSSKFARGNRWGVFPGVSGVWNAGKENFMKNLKFLDALDVRAGWGVVGGQGAVAPYSSMQLLYGGRTSFGADAVTGTYAPFEAAGWNQGYAGLANPDLTWEKTQQLNMGVDFRMFQGKLDLSVDVYHKVTSDLLMYSDVPASIGYTKLWQNVAELQNQGVELTLSSVFLNKKDWRWSASVNASRNVNKVLKLNGVDNDYIEVGGSPGVGTTSGALFKIVPGRPIGEFWGFNWQGMYDANTVKDKPGTFQPTALEGSYRFADRNGDGYLTDKDATVIGSNLPDVTGGLQTALSWKFLSLSAAFSFSIGNDIYASYLTNFADNRANKNTLRWAYTDSYRYLDPEMTDAEWNAAMARNARAKTPPPGINGNLMQSDFFVFDASYLKLREITLSAQLPKKVIKRLMLTKASVFFTCNNAFVWTKYEGFNPEIGGSGMTRGVDEGRYPNFRTYTMGVVLGF